MVNHITDDNIIARSHGAAQQCVQQHANATRPDPVSCNAIDLNDPSWLQPA
jgi:hypothetical protein